MITPTQARRYFEARLDVERFRGHGEVSLNCPFHNDANPSFSVHLDKGVWCCHAGCGAGGVLDFEQQFSDCDRDSARKNVDAVLRERVFTSSNGRQPVAVYKYTDARGRLLFEKLRYEPKDFRYRHEDDSGCWIWKQGDERVPYNLPQLIAAANVIYVEGEKDCDNVSAALAALKLTKSFAVTTSGSTEDWQDEFANYFTGRDVVIIPDNDDPGRKHAEKVAGAIHRLAAGVKIVTLPDLPEKGDVSNFLETHSAEELLAEIRQQRTAWTPAENAAQAEAEEPISPRFSEDAMALRFSGEYGTNLQYTAAWGKWHLWQDPRYCEDHTLNVYDRVRTICRTAASECDPDKEKSTKTRLTAAATIAAVERLARSDRRHAARVEQWDAHPFLLNTPAGTINLLTGELRPARREDFLTRSTAVAPAMESPELWFKFLERITDGDREKISYMQRVGGYALTGSVKEEALFFAYGPGANGKDVFFGTLLRILADYAQTAAMEMFCLSKSDRHPTELAALRGARLVCAQETERGRTWAESRIKMLTGGNRIRAHFMRKDDFEFEPEFKLILYGNYKPSLRGVTESIRRRFHIIPFDQIIPPEERDPKLKEKLIAEWPGILQWFIEGCREWQRIGLADPQCVTQATQQYLEGQDLTALWVEANIDFELDAFTPIAAIGANYREWCEKQGRNPQDVNALIDELIANYPDNQLRRNQRRVNDRVQRGLVGVKIAQ